MRVLVQRVSRAAVRFSGNERAIGPGLLVFVGVGASDTDGDAVKLAEKCAQLRIFSDDRGRFDRSLVDTGGEALVVSQFTLYGDCRKGRRPDFGSAMPPERAKPLYERFVEALRCQKVPIQTGEFGAHMQVDLINDGPVTLWLDSGAS